MHQVPPRSRRYAECPDQRQHLDPNHLYYAVVLRVKVLSLIRAFGVAPRSRRNLMYSRWSMSGFGTGKSPPSILRLSVARYSGVHPPLFARLTSAPRSMRNIASL